MYDLQLMEMQVVEGMDVVQSLATLPAVKDNSSSGYVKCAPPAPRPACPCRAVHLTSHKHDTLIAELRFRAEFCTLCTMQDCKDDWGQEG